MPNSPEVLKRLLVKVDRAYKHILDFQECARLFLYQRPYEVFHQDDQQTGERTYYLRVLKEMPPEFPALIGDTLQNLRSALDHLAWHLVKSSTVIPKAKDRDVYFPIFESAREYNAGKLRKTEGMAQSAKRRY